MTLGYTLNTILTFEGQAKGRIFWILASLPISLLERLGEMRCDAQSIVTASGFQLSLLISTDNSYSRMTDERLYRRRKEL
jgi:hypothetical protein